MGEGGVMNLKINLTDSNSCNDCPCLNNLKSPFCCHYGTRMSKHKKGHRTRVVRLKRCIKENGL